MDRFDVVVIGAGLSGLVDAILLAETGRRVVVLEQHSVPGGYLQQFQRKGTVFDVGFHYVGSTAPRMPLRRMLEHLQVHHRIEWIPFPDDAAIEVRSGRRSFAFPSRWERFVEKAQETWPREREGIARLAADVERTCALFKWFDLGRDKEYGHPLDLKLSTQSFRQYLSYVEDPWLREALFAQSFNLGLHAHEIPWIKHALAFRANFDTTSRMAGGGGALVAALVERGKELGVEYRFRCGVAGFECEGREARAVETAKGERFAADLFVAACHPKPILRAIPDDAMKPEYKRRVLDLKDSRGALQVWLRLKRPLESLGETAVMLRAPEPDPATGIEFLLANYPTAAEGGPPRLEALTYLDQAPFARWRNRPVMRRGEEYERLKRKLADRMIAMVASLAPELPDAIEDVYAATPLTDEWYTRNAHGAVFGVSHDLSQQGTNRPMPRMRLKNVWYSGHSLAMPGICGVVINAFDTCDMIRADGILFDRVAI